MHKEGPARTARNHVYLTPPALAELMGLDVSKILTWIRRGELQAFNAATTAAGRPRYLISPSAIQEFEQRRAVVPKSARRTRRPRDTRIIEFY
jgi:hypothetical protein